MTKQLEIYYDMDEVLYDLSSYIINKYNKDFNDDMKPNDNKSYWWSDCNKASKEYFKNLLLEKGAFYKSSPVNNSINIATILHEKGFKIKIITLPQYNSDYCVSEKVKWIKEYLPFINVEKDLVFTGDKSLLARDNRVLLDDNINNLIEWKRKDGISVAFSQHWNDKWKGLRVSNHKEFYTLIHQIQNNLINNNAEKSIDLHNLKFHYENKLHKGE
ncbi:TPA: 5' nucleotidase, NT5C type [Clostridium botulinum]|uniref:5' nucleotidase, NT5C type n=2 Tax=Clostridium botulinum TaxID=1491 RepID=UPI000466960F|nr:hypothetical protein [Clostridium botulinum]APH20807.1 5' nucleotidase, deoxy family protein [Clostridium botulinum]APQ71196.1 5' nucleotidase, deoxy family protein [Clostridium botulinum]APR02360.1 5' nucleotidase, deoxy family protein [Clostridium botulinum]AUN01546.1 hypothetical protein RSJ19_00760 [Clostridium botulinum]MBN3359263.1 hypothetical protein [Clostridium botulinum]